MRPVFYEFPETLTAGCYSATSFMLGGQLLVAPAPELESPAAYQVCLPAGRWYDYWTGAEIGSATAETLKETPTIARLPVFVRGGSIVPRQPLVQSTRDTPKGPLMLEVYPGASGESCHGELYADDGHSLEYTRGEFLRQSLHCTMGGAGMPSGDELTLEFDQRAGTFHPWWKQMEIVVHGWRGTARAMLDGRAVATRADTKTRTLSITVGDLAGAAKLIIQRARSPARSPQW